MVPHHPLMASNVCEGKDTLALEVTMYDLLGVKEEHSLGKVDGDAYLLLP